jgi:hypothetical protein
VGGGGVGIVLGYKLDVSLTTVYSVSMAS